MNFGVLSGLCLCLSWSFCNACCEFVGMSTSLIDKDHKFKIDEYIVWVVSLGCLYLFSQFCFPDQSIFIIILIKFCTTKDCEILMGNNRLLYLSLTARIIFLSVLVCEI